LYLILLFHQIIEKTVSGTSGFEKISSPKIFIDKKGKIALLLLYEVRQH
jgi:hypothetical protein